MVVRAVRGMKDILPEQAARWHWLEQTFRSIVERFGFGEVRTPLVEATELFVREIGEDTDVVEKEMYSFERHGDALTIRPEGTAGAARAYVQHSVSGREPVSRWYYIGPQFRAERPAKGRYRQFHQCGCEIYGDAGPLCDAELIDMCAQIATQLGVGAHQIHINSLGSGDTRQRYRDALREYFLPHKSSLSEDSQRRLDSNPLRILDSKAQQDKEIAAGAPDVVTLLEGDDREHFDLLKQYLDALEVPYVVDPTLARGLDYYTRTLFELKTTSGELGAQDTLIGGGRYDNMVANLGSKKAVPAIGFAMGIERILALSDREVEQAKPACYLAPMGEKARPVALKLAKQLRALELRCEIDGRGQSLKSMLRRANSLGSRLCVLLGEDELARAVVTVKDLARREQVELPLDGVANELKRRAELPAGGEASQGMDGD